jgi:hypothetical protein
MAAAVLEHSDGSAWLGGGARLRQGQPVVPYPNRSINREYRMIRQTARRLCGLIGSCLLIEVLGPTRTINRD